jgi:tetratricopeptide (TPR) repeat protein
MVARGTLAPLSLALLAGATSIARADPPVRDDLRALTARIRRQPSDVDALIQRSELYLRDGEPDEALADLRVADALAPAEPRVHAQRAAVLHALDRDDEALAELDACLARTRAPTIDVLALRARVLVAIGRLPDAVEEYDAALGLGDQVDLHLERGRVLERLGRFEDAARGYLAGLRALGGAITLARAAIELDLRIGRADRALGTIDAVILRAPARARWLSLRGRALDALGRREEARADRERALAELDARIARRPTAALRVERGAVLLALGRIGEARNEAARARSVAPRLGDAIDLELAVRRAGPAGAR